MDPLKNLAGWSLSVFGAVTSGLSIPKLSPTPTPTPPPTVQEDSDTLGYWVGDGKPAVPAKLMNDLFCPPDVDVPFNIGCMWGEIDLDAVEEAMKEIPRFNSLRQLEDGIEDANLITGLYEMLAKDEDRVYDPRRIEPLPEEKR